MYNFNDNEIDKIELTLAVCKYLKKYNKSLFTSIFGFGNGADYIFIRKFYELLDTKDEYLKHIDSMLEDELIKTLNSVEYTFGSYTPDNTAYARIEAIEFIRGKLESYII